MGFDDEFFEGLLIGIEDGFERGRLKEIEARLREKQKEMTGLREGDERYEGLSEEIFGLRDEKKQIMLEEAERKAVLKRVEDLLEFVKERDGEKVEYDEGLVRRLVEKVVIFDERIRVVFKSGIEVDV